MRKLIRITFKGRVEMTSSFARKALLGTATAALVGASLAGSAHAAVRFVNVADKPIIFEMRCAASDQTYRWTVAVDDTLAVTCNNGARQALVKLYTNDGAVVSRIVNNGATYQVGFDADGDATISAAW
jgi:hypothetical protein